MSASRLRFLVPARPPSRLARGLRLAAALLAGCALARVARAAEPAWEHVGWGGGGFYFSAAFHPTRDGVLYLGGDVSGVYKSTDHGRAWRLVNTGLTNYAVYSLATDVQNPDRVYAVTEGGLHKSTDAGETWRLVPRTGPKDLRITAERTVSIRALAVDPSNGDTVYAASPSGKVFKSTDAAETWLAVYPINGDTPKSGPLHSVAVSPLSPASVAAASRSGGVLLSEDAGKSWRALRTPAKAASVAFDPADRATLYGAFFSDGAWKSTDRGATWLKISRGLPAKFSAREIVASPARSRELYLIGAEGWSGGFYYSTDAGANWTRSSAVAPDHAANPTLPDDAPSGKTPLSTPTNLTLNPLNPRQLFISANWRPAFSEDAGRTWTERVRGADISVITDIRFSGARTYVTAMDEGTLLSEDAGQSWRQLWPRKYQPELSGHNWRIAVTPRDGVDRLVATVSPWEARHANRVVVSEDGGATHRVVTTGLPDRIPRANTMWGQGYARALTADPSNPDTLYLGIDGDPDDKNPDGGGLFKSIDGGLTWQRSPGQPASRRVYYGLAVDPTDSRRLFWGACGKDGGLHRSEDGGLTWQHVFSGEPWVFNLHVAPDGTIYAGGKNLWRSADHGATWQQVTRFNHARSIVGIEVHPQDSRTLWISAVTWDYSSDGGVFKSTDAGATWTDITGNLSYAKPQILRFNPATSELWAGQTLLHKIRQ